LIGSEFNAPPEWVLKPAKSSEKSDIWQVGLVAYEMFTHSHPFSKFETSKCLYSRFEDPSFCPPLPWSCSL